MRRLRRALRSLAQAAIRLALRSARLRRLLTAELRGDATRPRPAALSEAVFVDRHGATHQLEAGLRDRLKPGWRTMVDPERAAAPPDDDALRQRTAAARASVRDLSTILESVTGRPPGGRVLEIGAYDGAVAYQLAQLPGTDVVASDLARYYVAQQPGEPSDVAVQRQGEALAAIRRRAARAAGVNASIVDFVEDDVARSTLPTGAFDLVVSFEVLEHVIDPLAAFESMARLLKPGGLAYHDYNPFFSSIGGHSLVTLDVPWGHARLDAADVERYLLTIRPAEAAQALRFYRESLNRMTRADLLDAVDRAGFEVLAILPWADRGNVAGLRPEVLADVRRAYPSATIGDLLATFTTIVLRRPG